MHLNVNQIEVLRNMVEAVQHPDSVNLSWLWATLAVEFPTLRGERQDDAVIRHLTSPPLASPHPTSSRGRLHWIVGEGGSFHLALDPIASSEDAPYSAWRALGLACSYADIGAGESRREDFDSHPAAIRRIREWAQADGYEVGPPPFSPVPAGDEA